MSDVEAMTTLRQVYAGVSMPYISGLSVNHLYGRKYPNTYMSPEAKKWKMVLKAKIAQAFPNIPQDARVVVHVDGYFKDRRSCPDPDNMAKILLDGVALGLGRSNDKLLTYETGDWATGFQEPELVISLEVR